MLELEGEGEMESVGAVGDGTQEFMLANTAIWADKVIYDSQLDHSFGHENRLFVVGIGEGVGRNGGD